MPQGKKAVSRAEVGRRQAGWVRYYLKSDNIYYGKCETGEFRRLPLCRPIA